MSATIYDDGQYLESNPTWHAEHSPWKAAQIVRGLREAGLNPRTIADVGCGAGETLLELSKTFPDAICTGFEVSPQAFAIAQPKARPGLSFEMADPFAAGRSFDVAMAIDVFEHVEDYRGFLRGMRGISTHQVYHIPIDLSAQTLLRAKPIRAVRSQVGHIHHFTKDAALATLEETGHEVLRWFYTGGALETPGRALRARIMAAPRRALFAAHPDFAVRLLGGWSLLAVCR